MRRWLARSPFLQCLAIWALAASVCTVVVAPVMGQSSAGGGGGGGGSASTVSVSNFPATQPVSGTVALGTGSNGIGYVQAQGTYVAGGNAIGNGGLSVLQLDNAGVLIGAEKGSSAPVVGIVPVTTQAGTSVVGKASQGNLYSAYAVNTTATAGFLACLNVASIPSSGAAIAPVDVASLAGASGATATIDYGAGPPNAYSAGVSCVITTSLTVYTPGGASFMQARVR